MLLLAVAAGPQTAVVFVTRTVHVLVLVTRDVDVVTDVDVLTLWSSELALYDWREAGSRGT